MSIPDYIVATPAELLGDLNEVEAKYAPKQLFLAGHIDIMRRGPRVSIVGSRKASAEGLRSQFQPPSGHCQLPDCITATIWSSIGMPAPQIIGGRMAIVWKPVRRPSPESRIFSAAAFEAL